MVDSLEEPMPESAAESVLASNMDAMPGESAGAVPLEMALSSPAMAEMPEMEAAAPPMADLGHIQQTRRSEGAMPQGALLNIPVSVQVVLGTTRMPLHRVMSLGPGSIVALDKELSEPVTLLVNGNEVARGLIVVVNEKTGQLGISLTEVLSNGAGQNPPKLV